MTAAGQRDVEAVRRGLEQWSGEPVDALTRPVGGGFSGDTYFTRLGARQVTVRLAPDGLALLPDYDLHQQAELMRAIAREIPVPAVIAIVDDRSYLGAPFLVTEFVDGRVPSDRPSYLTQGWLYDVSPDAQRTLHDNFFDVCARIHRAALPASGLRVGLGAEIDWWCDYLDWATDGAPPPSLADAFAACRDAQPSRSAAD
ncbi:MAG TPA: phosphotransferase, partial [Acidimicrobiia bacterium]|nr:phosphotransferase [Acidimicrobiia bacterium]